MAQGEFWVERQNWARWPRVLKVNRHTDHGTETRRYLPERHEAAWSEREYAVGKIAELQAENAKLRELVSTLAHCAASGCDSCPINGGCARVGELDLCATVHDRMRELGVEADG